VSTPPFKILFLCTGNSARSIMGEYIIRRVAPGRFQSFSAGAKPSGKVNPMVLRVLSEMLHIDASEARSKSWEEFKDVHFDFVITVCDNAKETCPVWPGQPIIAHWSSPDPALFEGTEEEKYKLTAQVAMQIHRRLDLFCSLPIEKMERIKLQTAMGGIGEKEHSAKPVESAQT
jgi:protein-tyrosine-phosphatase